MTSTDKREPMQRTVVTLDSVLRVRKTIRHIGDLSLPTRRGIAATQIGVFFLTLFVSLILVAGLVMPLVRLLHLHPHFLVTIGLVFALPVLASQRVTKPMAFSKTIPTTLTSWVRFHVADDKTHRRGMPLPANRGRELERRAHFQREWVAYPQVVADDPAEAPWTDPDTEARMRGPVPDLQDWFDTKTRDAVADVQRAATIRKTQEKDTTFAAGRGRASSVTLPPSRAGQPTNDRSDA